jgi:hypothetical protein
VEEQSELAVQVDKRLAQDVKSLLHYKHYKVTPVLTFH